MVKDVKAGKKKKKCIEGEPKQVEENIGEQQDTESCSGIQGTRQTFPLPCTLRPCIAPAA
jgi:hypothetical protein